MPSVVNAIGFSPLSIEALTDQSELILQGTVLSKTCLRDKSGRIYTQVELAVTEVWKGAISGSPFLIVHGGGVLGEEQSVVSGQAPYELGKEVVAFLVRNERGEGVTVGLMQGKFDVQKDPNTGTHYVAHPFLRIPEQGKMALKSGPGAAGARGRMPLAELKKQVHGLVR